MDWELAGDDHARGAPLRCFYVYVAKDGSGHVHSFVAHSWLHVFSPFTLLLDTFYNCCLHWLGNQHRMDTLTSRSGAGFSRGGGEKRATQVEFICPLRKTIRYIFCRGRLFVLRRLAKQFGFFHLMLPLTCPLVLRETDCIAT